MFSVGLGPIADSFFVASTMIIAIPTGIKIFNWLGTMSGGTLRFTSAMLFSIGFIAMFVIGGLSVAIDPDGLVLLLSCLLAFAALGYIAARQVPLTMAVDPSLLVQGVAVAVAASLLAGLYPAWKLAAASPAPSIREASAASSWVEPNASASG